MPQVGFKPMITASKQAKTVHVLDRSATVTSLQNNVTIQKPMLSSLLRLKVVFVSLDSFWWSTN
jgi:hypothetical protein